MHHNQKIRDERGRREDGIKEISRKKKSPQLNKMPKNPNLYFACQKVVSADVLLLNQSQLPKLLKMMLSHAWTAEMQRLLNFANAHRSPSS
jgi:hypothetical protein